MIPAVSEFTTIAIHRGTADAFKALARSHRLRQYELASRLVALLEGRDFGAQERLLGLRANVNKTKTCARRGRAVRRASAAAPREST